MTVCWRCGATPAVYTKWDTCFICGRPTSTPKPAPEKHGTWTEPIRFGKRETMLPRIDQGIAAQTGQEERQRQREEALATALKRRSLMKKVGAQ